MYAVVVICSRISLLINWCSVDVVVCPSSGFRSTDLSRAQRTLSKSLDEFNFECIGSTQTDDEQVIVDSLKQFSRMIESIEDERDNMVSVSPVFMFTVIIIEIIF